MSAHRVVVVGGGIAGLAAARRLSRDRGNEFQLTVLEASPRFGGAVAPRAHASR